mmetsp:Transcript_27200/g.58270  ORF Transcript_27200/g.58270 Transcript_27200/m.58270 type:complete len:115 (+) Transcript_27200:1545-1889(+)
MEEFAVIGIRLPCKSMLIWRNHGRFRLFGRMVVWEQSTFSVIQERCEGNRCAIETSKRSMQVWIRLFDSEAYLIIWQKGRRLVNDLITSGEYFILFSMPIDTFSDNIGTIVALK